MQFAKKNEYDGQWKNGKKSGEGAYTYASTGLTYICIFEDDNPIKIIEKGIEHNKSLV